LWVANVIGDGTLVAVATYNESENIVALVTQILETAGGCHILVVDDNSPDGTGELVTEMMRGNARIELLTRPSKLGLGTAYMAAFDHALRHGYDRILTMDADFSHHPRHLPAILARAADPEVDIVIGARYVQGGGVVGWPLYRRLLSFGANTFARTLLGLHSHDCTGAYRCYSRRVAEGLEPQSLFSHGYSALIELLWQFERAGYRIAEVPITFADRELGQSKVSRAEIRRGLTTVLKLRFAPPPLAIRRNREETIA
jgi:glycosyltransferase involved in cell wall biosynthesis